MANIYDVLSALSKKGATFASFVYTNAEGETAKHRLILGATTEELYQKDVVLLTESIIPALEKAVANAVLNSVPTHEIETARLNLLAANKVLVSRQTSLTVGIGNNPRYQHQDTYTYVEGLRGVRIHKETGEVYVNGLSQSKKVLIPGVYKVVKSAPLTIAQNIIKKGLPSGKYRLFKLDRLTEAHIRGGVLKLK